ncbi:rho GTPase-activating protein 24 isoform X2 [Gadus morhua]|uniref:Rho GTPase activating protein 24 n=3 Tax=Gadus morhua TaxID=8049 RepID=A0A8C5BJ03_GADMO|nr:rho GTPase-activating protein 24 isoform X2 [Gadus morhua]
MEDQAVSQRVGGPAAHVPGPGGGPARVVRCGWLKKQGGFVKTWHTRWFVLRREQLCYYKDEEENKALGTIVLSGNRVTEHATNGDEGGKFLFEIAPGGDRERMTANHETYLLMANTQNDMEDWVKTIRRVIWAPFGGGIFGQKLEETVRYERRYGNKLAPMLVEQCVDFIREQGLQEEGLFRLPGQANLVKELQDAFDCGEKPSFDRNTDVHTVASLLKLYLRELPEPVVPFSQYDCFLACTKLLSKDDATGIAELRKLVKALPQVNYNLLTYICRFLDEVQSYSGVNKMSVQNLGTVFGPNILRPKIEDPVAIMEGTVLVQQLMAVLIGRHDALFPDAEDVTTAMERASNNNNELPSHRPLPVSSGSGSAGQNVANNNATQSSRQCAWEAPDPPPPALQPTHPQHHAMHVDNGSPPPHSLSPRNSLGGRFDLTRNPPLTLKKNPAFSKGSGIVTNGSFSSTSPGGEGGAEKGPALGGGGGGGGGGVTGGGSLPGRRNAAHKGSGTKMGTSGVTNGGGARLGVSSTDVVNGSLNGRNGLWVPNGHVTLRDNSKARDGEHGHSSSQNRLSTYDNVQLNQLNLQQQQQQHHHHHPQQHHHLPQHHPQQTQPGDGCSEDKQSVDSATWSTSSCEISLPDNSTSCRSSTTTCPEQDFYAGHYDEPDGPAVAAAAAAAAMRESEGAAPGGGGGEAEGRHGANGRGRRGTSSSDTSDGYPVSNGTSSHSALHSLVAGLKQEMNKQKSEYEARIKSLEQRNLELETDMAGLNEELDQERKKYTMVEIKLRNAERAKEDAERRNHMLQKEMEQFFTTFGDLTAGPGASTASAAAAAEPPRRADRANSIWIQ